MATPTMVSRTTKTSTAASAEPRSPNELPGAGSREPGSDDPIAFRASASSRISVAAGPGERNQDGAGGRCSECGRQVICDRPIVLDGRRAGSAGILQGDIAVG